jgi:hypothetical protein
MPDSVLWRDEWSVLGFLSGPPLLSLFRPSLVAGLPTSGGLDDLAGKEVVVAGLLAQAEKSAGGDEVRMTYLDEWGLFEVRKRCRDDQPLPDGLGPWLVRGKGEDRHGAVIVIATKLERVIPTGATTTQLRVFAPRAEAC